MLDVDTRFSPNPDMMIFQRLQQLIDFAVSSRLTSIQPNITTSFSNTPNNTFYPFINSSKSTISQIPIKPLSSMYTNNLTLPSWDKHREGKEKCLWIMWWTISSHINHKLRVAHTNFSYCSFMIYKSVLNFVSHLIKQVKSEHFQWPKNRTLSNIKSSQGYFFTK